MNEPHKEASNGPHPDFTLVLGGGGMRGLAHVGVLAALEQAGLRPTEIVGSSVGSLIAAAYCTGMHVDDMRELALAMSRRDLFRVAHRDMALKRMRSPALYRREPLDELLRGLLGGVTFDDLERRLIVNTVDINDGIQVFWGLDGLREVPVADAVFASCALPGYLPPRKIGERYYVDGAVVSNLPVGIAAALKRPLVIASDVGADRADRTGMENTGFAAIIARTHEVAIQTMRDARLANWSSPPLVLLRPEVDHIPLFSFRHNEELVDVGFRHTRRVLSQPLPTASDTGVFPRRSVRVRVDSDQCVGCGTCLMHAPDETLERKDDGKVAVRQANQIWSPADGAYVRSCPVDAIHVTSR